MLHKIRCKPMHLLHGALPEPYVLLRVTQGAVIAHQYTYAPHRPFDPYSTTGLLFPCQYLCGTILVTPYSIVWDWRVSRARPITFYLLSCSLTFCLLLVSRSLLSLCGLVLWGWGIRTDRVLITHSQPFTANIF